MPFFSFDGNRYTTTIRRNCIAVLMGIATTTIRRNCIAGLWQGAVVVRVLGERHAQAIKVKNRVFTSSLPTDLLAK
nr:uncharacterized protein LOC109774964 isoform X2 [Aegilops tauschii subsp. strangulata]